MKRNGCNIFMPHLCSSCDEETHDQSPLPRPHVISVKHLLPLANQLPPSLPSLVVILVTASASCGGREGVCKGNACVCACVGLKCYGVLTICHLIAVICCASVHFSVTSHIPFAHHSSRYY